MYPLDTAVRLAIYLIEKGPIIVETWWLRMYIRDDITSDMCAGDTHITVTHGAVICASPRHSR